MPFFPKGLAAVLGFLVTTSAFGLAVGEEIEAVLRSSADSGCLQVLDASPADGGRLVTGPCDGLPHQRWRLVYLGEGHYLVRADHGPRKCLDASAPHDGAWTHQWTCHWGLNQRWRFLPLPSGAYLIRIQSNAFCMTLGRLEGLPLLYQTACRSVPEQSWIVDTL
jgi:hypothetical protein